MINKATGVLIEVIRKINQFLNLYSENLHKKTQIKKIRIIRFKNLEIKLQIRRSNNNENIFRFI